MPGYSSSGKGGPATKSSLLSMSSWAEINKEREAQIQAAEATKEREAATEAYIINKVAYVISDLHNKLLTIRV